MTTNGTGFIVLKSFTGTGGDGSQILAGLALDTNGTLYGAAWVGGSAGFGNLFKLSTNGTGYQVLTNLTGTAGNAPGSSPRGTLVIGTDGLLYGTAQNGGGSNQGVIFRLNRNGSGYTVLRNFTNDLVVNLIYDGANPVAGLVQGRDGGFYGATLSGGQIPFFGSEGVGSIFSLGSRPGNDAFTNRIPLGGATAIGQGNNLNATAEANEPIHGCPTLPVTNSAWWSWSGLSNGLVTIVNTNGAVNSIIDVYQITTNSPGCIAPPPGLLDWWPANLDASDLIGGNNGTLLNGVGFAAGKVSQAFNFAGTLSPTGSSKSNRIQIGGTPITPPWTAEFWVNRQDCLTNSAVLLGDAFTALKLEQISSGRKVGFTTWSNTDFSFNYVAPAGTWTHLVFAASSTSVSLYTNGVFQSSVAAANINLPRGQIGNDITNRYERPVRGLVDEVSLYSGLLSGSQIAALFNAGAAGKCVSSGVASVSNLTRVVSSGVPCRFDNNASLAIPDNTPAGVGSPIVVSNFPFVLEKVTVSLFLTHSRDSDLSIQLISPEGTNIVLSANNGDINPNYGVDCDNRRTVFDDYVTNSIGLGFAPFEGSFSPTQPLSVLAGKSGSGVNGTWQLRVVDQVSGEIGSIQCWSLTLYPVDPLNRVSFNAVTGATYQVAVSGVGYGGAGSTAAGSGDISLAMRTLDMRLASVIPIVNTNNLTTRFGVVTQIGNARAFAPGPLRLQFIAQPGYSFLQTEDLPSALPPEQILTNYYLANPSNVSPGLTTNVTVTNMICPAPTNYVAGGSYAGWGVFVRLQEQVGTNWLTKDSLLAGYGVWPNIAGFNGPGGGVIRIDPVAGGGVSLSSVKIIGPIGVNEGSTNLYHGEAHFDEIGYIYPFTNTVWTSGIPAISALGVFTPGIVTNTAQTTLTCYYNYDTTASANLAVWVTNLPSPVLTNLTRLPNKQYQFTIKGVPGRKQVIQATTNVANPSAWTNLVTITNNAAGTNVFIDTSATNYPRRFYRAFETP
jgi:uncharacterized repeat protein (TIGR03803 family)